MPFRYLAVALCLFAASAQAEDKRRASAHEHGLGRLDIAIEGNTVAMALRVPGADIVGFEHAAKSDADKAALADALAKLKKPLTLFVPPATAACTVTAAEAEFETDQDEERKDGGKENDHGKDAKHEEGKDRDEEGHAEFHAEYQLSCDKIDALDHMEFAYFAQFPAAEELEVQVISDKGQKGAEMTPDATRLDLAGMI